MNEPMHSSNDQVAATLLGFAAGEAVARPYDGWSKPPTTEVVEHTLRGRLSLGWATRQLIATLTSLADNDGLDAAALSRALAAADDGIEPTPDPSASHAAVPIATRQRNELASCASRSIAAGLWQRVPAAAAALGRDQATATEQDDVSIDTAGVVAAATAICLNQEWRGDGAGHLAELVIGHAHTDAVRRQLERAARWHEVPPPPTAARELGNGADALPLIGPALLAASLPDSHAAIRWSARVGNHPSQITAVGAALATARTYAHSRQPRFDVTATTELLALAERLEVAHPSPERT